VESEILQVEDELKSFGAIDPGEIERMQQKRIDLTKARSDLESKLTTAWEVELDSVPVHL
jgi:hypothetical protein